MASSAEMMYPLPDTLPEDFSEWDSGYSAAARSVNFNPSAAAVDDSSGTRPSLRSPDPQYSVSRALDGSTDLPRFTANSFNEADEFLLRSFRLQEAREISPKPSTKKRTVAVVVGVAPLLVLLAFVPGVNSGVRYRLGQAKQSIVNLSKSADKNPAANTASPSSTNFPTGVAQSSTIEPKPSPLEKSATGKLGEVTPSQMASKMMTEQLTAPAQISHEIDTAAPREAPPASGFGAAGAEGLDGAGSNGANLVRTVFATGNNGPIVSPEFEKVTVSSGVAASMFLDGAKPQYPVIAKPTHASGTVVLQATISREGTIENLRVNSGPSVLAQAAMEAVSTWRYRPYLFNGRPVEIDTTINVVFADPGE
jgi:periplasmic protein TonB